MDEYIGRGVALQVIETCMKKTAMAVGGIVAETYELAIKHACDFLRLIPTADVVEVVRCKDCQHWTPCEGGKDYCCLDDKAVVPNDFCSYGERMEEDG